MDLYLSATDKANGLITVGDMYKYQFIFKDGNLISYTKTDFSGSRFKSAG